MLSSRRSGLEVHPAWESADHTSENDNAHSLPGPAGEACGGSILLHKRKPPASPPTVTAWSAARSQEVGSERADKPPIHPMFAERLLRPGDEAPGTVVTVVE